MSFHHFRYSYEFFSTSPAFPNGGRFRQARLDVNVANGHRSQRYSVVIDSGATQCLFPISVGFALGVDVYKLPQSHITGVSGSLETAYHAPLRIEYPGVFDFEVYAGFTRGLDRLEVGLLGQSGFFDRVTVTFDHRNDLFTLEH